MPFLNFHIGKNSGAFQYTLESYTLTNFPGGSAKWCNPLSGNWQYLPKLYMHLSFVSAFSHLGIYPEDTPPKNKQTKQMFIQCVITGHSKILGTI